MRGASAAEVMSNLDNASVKAIEQTPGVARDAQGRAIASAELVVAANLPVKGGAPDEDGSVQLRGIGPQAWAVRPDVEIIEGQRFGTGKREIVVRSEEHTSELQSLMRISYAVFCLKKNNTTTINYVPT